MELAPNFTLYTEKCWVANKTTISLLHKYLFVAFHALVCNLLSVVTFGSAIYIKLLY